MHARVRADHPARYDFRLTPDAVGPMVVLMTNTITIKNRSAGRLTLTIRDGVVVGAFGSDPARFVGLTEARARHVARYGGK